LTVTVLLADGRELTGIQIQRYYLDACRRFLEASDHPPAEAWEVVDLWDHVLAGLETAPEAMVGRIDWATKRYLLENTATSAAWAERKKIDIKYHQLDAGGYFSQLKQTGLTDSLLTEEEIDRAVRTAPPESPATMRGHFIREFADGDQPLSVNWRRIVLGSGKKAKVVNLGRYVDK
jgi:proteasome accessory factor A